MEQRNFRTYRRRAVTRKSGYHTCEGTTGSECVVVSAQKYRMAGGRAVFVFRRQTVQLTQLFENQCGMLAFGGFIYAPKAAKIAFILSYAHNGVSFTENFAYEGPVNAGNWNGIGFHREIDLAGDDILTDVKVTMTIETDAAELEFVCFDLDAVTKAEYRNAAASTSFYQKTSMHIPYLYYLNSRLPFEQYQNPRPKTEKGRWVVLKSCNRCGRFLPIDIGNEVNTLAFSLHCKKRAPCVHSAFRAYTICNSYDEDELRRAGIETEQGKVISYYGHQLECKACKKFFVNAPLNPQRNA